MLDDERPLTAAEMVEYDERGRVKRRGHPERGDTAPVAWCGPHDCHPLDCFELHYPNAHRKDPDGQVQELQGESRVDDHREGQEDADQPAP